MVSPRLDKVQPGPPNHAHLVASFFSSSALSHRGIVLAYLDTWKSRARALKRETYALYLACRDPRTPWYAKTLAVCVIAYALSSIDLIPDPIPIIGQLVDFLLVPLGILLVCRLIPEPVLAECRSRAAESVAMTGRGRWVAAIVIVACWIAVGWLVARWIWFFVKA